MNMKAIAPYLVGVAAAGGVLYWLIGVQKGAVSDPYQAAAENGASPWAWDRLTGAATSFDPSTWFGAKNVDMGSLKGLF